MQPRFLFFQRQINNSAAAQWAAFVRSKWLYLLLNIYPCRSSLMQGSSVLISGLFSKLPEARLEPVFTFEISSPHSLCTTYIIQHSADAGCLFKKKKKKKVDNFKPDLHFNGQECGRH